MELANEINSDCFVKFFVRLHTRKHSQMRFTHLHVIYSLRFFFFFCCLRWWWYHTAYIHYFLCFLRIGHCFCNFVAVVDAVTFVLLPTFISVLLISFSFSSFRFFFVCNFVDLQARIFCIANVVFFLLRSTILFVWWIQLLKANSSGQTVENITLFRGYFVAVIFSFRSYRL